MNRESNFYTIVYASVMVVIVAIALAFTSQALKAPQKENERIDKMQQILRSVHVAPDKSEVVKVYNNTIKKELLIAADGSVVATFEGKDIASNEAFSMNTANAFFEVSQGNAQQVLPLYIAEVGGATKYIFPMNGAGLWGPIWGFMALDADCNTVFGADFSHKGETPGLGAEITTARFSERFVGKHFFRNGDFRSVAVVKSGQHLAEQDYIDGISGGTLTSNGVHDMLHQSLSFYVPYIKQLLTEESKR